MKTQESILEELCQTINGWGHSSAIQPYCQLAYVRNPDHIKAHLLICMIALTVMQIIQNRTVKSGVVPSAAQITKKDFAAFIKNTVLNLFIFYSHFIFLFLFGIIIIELYGIV